MEALSDPQIHAVYLRLEEKNSPELSFRCTALRLTFK